MQTTSDFCWGVGNGAGIWARIHGDGAVGVSMGSPFIATTEAPVSEEYKQACVDYGARHRFTTKISGSPCTVIRPMSKNWYKTKCL